MSRLLPWCVIAFGIWAPTVVASEGDPPPPPLDDVEEGDELPPEDPAEQGGVWGFVYTVNNYYPIILDPNLEPEVDDNVVLLWVTTAICGQACGPLWIPMLIVGEYPGDAYFIREAIWAIITSWMTLLAGGVGSSAYGLGSILIVANLLYFAPVSLINTYDRSLKAERAREALLVDEDPPPEEARSAPRSVAPPAHALAMAF